MKKTILTRVLALIGAVFTIITATVLPTFAYTVIEDNAEYTGKEFDYYRFNVHKNYLGQPYSSEPIYLYVFFESEKPIEMTCSVTPYNYISVNAHKVQLALTSFIDSNGCFYNGMTVVLDDQEFCSIRNTNTSGTVRLETWLCDVGGDYTQYAGWTDWSELPNTLDGYTLEFLVPSASSISVGSERKTSSGRIPYVVNVGNIFKTIFEDIEVCDAYSYSEGYWDGEDYGYNEGYGEGQAYGESLHADDYSNGYTEGEAVGWQNGEAHGITETQNTFKGVKNVVFAIFDAPVRLIDGMLDFELFGINLSATVKVIVTLAVVAAIVAAIMKFVKG